MSSDVARRALCILLVTLLALPHVASAGVFTVTPVRLYMTPRDRAIAVTIVNDGDTDVVLQADVNTWTQTPDGTDQLQPTEDLVLAPPIVRLAPKARQVVRLAMLAPPDVSRQLTYRLIVREVPEALAPPASGVQTVVALALSMPVFITPPAARRQVNCIWSGGPGAEGPSLACSNTGTAYAQVREAVVSQGDRVLARFEGGTYILPGATKALPLKSESAVPGGALTYTVRFDDGQSSTGSVQVQPR